jgi:peroxin-3
VQRLHLYKILLVNEIGRANQSTHTLSPQAPSSLPCPTPCRNKRRVLALAAAGAAGVAASYYTYRWWTSPSQEIEQGEEYEEDREVLLSGGATPQLPRPRAADADAHLQRHFDSIQEIADATTVPSLLPALSKVLAQSTGVEALLEGLRAPANGAGALAPADKLAAWERLKVAAAVQLVAAAWALPLLNLLVRVKLNVLGRRLYLESALEARKPGTAGLGGARGAGAGGGNEAAGIPPRLSAASQERFLSYAEHLAREGHARLVAAAAGAAEAIFENIPLQRALSANDMAALLSEALEAVEPRPGGDGWLPCLLPSPEAVRESLSLLPAGAAADSSQVDGPAVEAMLVEVARVVSTERFHDAAAACAKQAARHATDRLSARMEGASLPLAKVAPLLSSLAGELTAPGTPCLAVLAGKEELRTLCATVYSCGPPA